MKKENYNEITGKILQAAIAVLRKWDPACWKQFTSIAFVRN
jgi:hypothetical protein